MLSSRKVFALLALFMSLTAMAGSAFAQDDAEIKVAVLPFEVLAGDDLAYLKESLPELLADRLTEAGFSVADPYLVSGYMADHSIAEIDLQTARNIAVASGASYALYGQFSQIGESISLESRFVDALGQEQALPVYVSEEGIINLLPLVDKLVAQVGKAALKQETLVAFDVEGTQVLDKEVVLIRIGMQKGDTYDPRVVNEELKRIYELGYFDDVQVLVSDVTGGKKVLFKVREKPRIQSIGVTGNDKLDDDDILEALTTKIGAVLNPNVLRDDLNTVRALYRRDGYYKTDVAYDIEGGETGQAKLNFIVTEGPKLYIKEIILNGAEQEDPDDIKSELALSEPGFFSWFSESDLLNEELLERDAAAIQAYYVTRGYLKAKIGRPEVDFRDDGIYVTFSINEGPRLKVGGVEYEGDLIADPSELNTVVKLDDLFEEGEYLNAAVVREDVESLINYYNDHGYAYADVGAKFADTEDQTGTKVVYTLVKHQRVHVRRVLLEGNAKTRDNVLMREMRLADGDAFSGSRLARSVERLERLGYFEDVDIQPLPTGDPDEIDLKVKVQEANTAAMSGSIGYSTSTGMFIAGKLSESNLFGKGYTLALTGQFGGSSNQFNLQFINPHVNDTAWGYSLFAIRSKDEYDDYDRRGIRGGFRISYPLGEYTVASVGYEVDSYTIYDVEDDAAESIQDDEGDHLASILTASINRGNLKRDSFFISSGSTLGLAMQTGGGALGGNDHFVKWGLDGQYYTSVVGDLVFRVRGHMDFVHETLGAGKIPIGQRIRYGGPETIRGYTLRKIAPLEDGTDDVIGGTKGLFTNLELLYPFSKEYGVLGLVFFDAGNAWKGGEWWLSTDEKSDEVGDEPSFGLYKSVGVGVRWKSPMGPMSIEYGYGFDELKDSASSKLEFRMGQDF